MIAADDEGVLAMLSKDGPSLRVDVARPNGWSYTLWGTAHLPTRTQLETMRLDAVDPLVYPPDVAQDMARLIDGVLLAYPAP